MGYQKHGKNEKVRLAKTKKEHLQNELAKYTRR